MKKSKIPDPMERRHWIERELGSAEALAIAEAYLAEDRAPEALAFLAKAGASEQLAAVAAQAVERGDAFLLREVARVTRDEPSPAQWQALAEAAEAAGRLLYAGTARRQAARGDDPSRN